MPEKKKHKRLRFALKMLALVLAALIVLPSAALLIIRAVNAVRLHIGEGGVQERIYISLGGYKQYVSIRGRNIGNPVVIFLHGGPGSPVGFLSYLYQPLLEGDYTFIQWDQRGCGRTYYKSPSAPLSLDNLLGDLDALVDYASARFHQPVYIVGHSWGTVLGLDYASKYPDKIAGYIGIGQETDDSESGRLQVQAAEDAARAAGHDPDSARMEELYAASKPFGDPAFDAAQLMELYGLENRYLDPGAKSETLPALVSPDFGWDDLRYQLLLMRDIKGHFVRQIPLMQAVTDFVPPQRLAAPAALIGGENDYTCSAVLAKKYADTLGISFYEIQKSGHSPMFDNPKVFAETLKEAITNLQKS